MPISPVATSASCTANKHGTAWAWIRYRCRCPEAVAEKKRQYDRSKNGRSTSGAKHSGAHPMHRDVDPESVRIACTREQGRVSVGATERRLVVEQLTAEGKSAPQIADRLGLAPRSVQRIRQRIREMVA